MVEKEMLLNQIKQLENKLKNPSFMNSNQWSLFEENEKRCTELTTKNIMLTQELTHLKEYSKNTIQKLQKRIQELERHR